MVGISYLLRKGTNWIKWVYLLWMLVQVHYNIDYIKIKTLIEIRPLVGYATITQFTLQIIFLVLLFTAKKPKTEPI
jgi:polyferredoxin